MNHDDESNPLCTRRSSLPSRGLRAVPCRYFTTFRTNIAAVPFIEVTVVAGSRKEAVRAAKQVLAPVKRARFSEVD